jgi:hypothetical protein
MPQQRLKQRQLSRLHAQLAQLESNISELDGLLRVTCFQGEHILKLGLMQGSLFMASHKVFEEEAREEPTDGG